MRNLPESACNAPAGAVETVILPKATLGMVRVGADDETRYAMRGMRIERGKEPETGEVLTRVVATDGKILAMVERKGLREGETEGPIEANLRRDGLEAAAKACKPPKNFPSDVTIKLNGEAHLTVPTKAGPVTIESKLQQGYFPPYREVFPQRENGLQIELDAKLLFELATAMWAASERDLDGHNPCVILRFAANRPESSPVLVDLRGGRKAEPQVSGLIMPINMSEEDR